MLHFSIGSVEEKIPSTNTASCFSRGLRTYRPMVFSVGLECCSPTHATQASSCVTARYTTESRHGVQQEAALRGRTGHSSTSSSGCENELIAVPQPLECVAPPARGGGREDALSMSQAVEPEAHVPAAGGILAHACFR